jgi:hypothetical protein
MTAQRGALPTLTEVIEVSAEPSAPAVLAPESLPLESAPPQAADSHESAAVLTHQVLTSLRPRIDALLEARLREAMVPLLARCADELQKGLRVELAAAMQALAAQAVDEALARRRKP